jgi:hypothetical protein
LSLPVPNRCQTQDLPLYFHLLVHLLDQASGITVVASASVLHQVLSFFFKVNIDIKMSILNSVNFGNSYMQKCWRQEVLGVSNSNRVGNKFC